MAQKYPRAFEPRAMIRFTFFLFSPIKAVIGTDIVKLIIISLSVLQPREISRLYSK